MTATITKISPNSEIHEILENSAKPDKPEKRRRKKLNPIVIGELQPTQSVAAQPNKKVNKYNKISMYSVGAVALTLTGLSLTHLTDGIQQVTNGDTLHSSLMAIGIDLGFVALEIAQVMKFPEPTTRTINKFAIPAIVGTLLASAALNALAFASHAHGLMVWPAIALGCAIPALIYCLTRVAVAMAKSL